MKSNLVRALSNRRIMSYAVAGLVLAAATAAYADPVLVNGGFEETLTDTSSQFGSAFPSQQVTGWTTSGYNFVFTPGTADTTGAAGVDGTVKFWGPGDGSPNGLDSSPAGGNFLAIDGVYVKQPVSTTITGLTPGTPVTVSFYWAGAQQYGYTGATTEGFDVSLGSETLSTPTASNASEGFTGWMLDSLTFTPTSTSEVLSFLATGTPDGVPPFSLLDGVTISSTSPVPEPSSLALLLTGAAGFGSYIRRRFKKDATNLVR